MQRFVLRRLLTGIPVFFGITIIMFFLINSTPGDPLAALINLEATRDEQMLQQLREELGLDRPVPVRYAFWLGQMIQGNLGDSFVTRRPVIVELQMRLPATLQLMGTALGLSLLIGIPLGVLSAVKRYSILDYLLTVGGFFWVSVPIFFFGLALLYIFALKLDLFPTSGMTTPGMPYSFWNNLHHMVLPAFAIATTNIAGFMRYTRAAMLEVIQQDYINTARAKGLRETVIVLRHGFRNALLPIVTLLSLTLPNVFGGAVITETIFQWPGIGMLYIQAVRARDYNLTMGISFFSALLILLSNLLADIAYAWVDPRIRYE